MSTIKNKKIPIRIEKINSSTLQLTKIATSVLQKVSEKFSFLPPGYKFHPKFRLMGIKGVKVRLIQPDGSFPSGLFSDVVEYLTEDLNKKVVMSKDVMEHFLPLTDFFPNGINDDVFSDYEFDGNPVILRDYQLGAVKAAFENRHGLLNLSTGAGKCLGGDTKLRVKIDESIVEKYRDLIEREGGKIKWKFSYELGFETLWLTNWITYYFFKSHEKRWH